VKRKPTTDDTDHAETVDADWMEPFKAPGKHWVINVDVMTPQQRAEAMARGVPAGVTNIGKFVELGLQTSKEQAERASKPRGDKALADIVRKLAKREGTAKELWPVLLDKLDAADCEPVEHTDGEQRQWKITYVAGGRNRGVSFDTFQRALGKNRKPE